MRRKDLMNPDGTCSLCGHMATEHVEGCSQCDCKLVAEPAKEPKDHEATQGALGIKFGLRLRKP
jgi:hypothetical protein